MKSANGYAVQCHHGRAHVASWPAPAFVFDASEPDRPCACLLVHVETIELARDQVRRFGGVLLGPSFELEPNGSRLDETRARVRADAVR